MDRLKIIIKKEILDAFFSYRFIIASLLCLVLIPLGIYVNLQEYKQRLADYQEAMHLYQQRAEGTIDLDFAAEGYRPPSVLSIFSVGLEYYLPNKITTSPGGVFHASNEQGINNPQSLLFGKVDLLFNVTFVISLLALIFSFSTITGEKEGGTLRMMLANPVPRWKILIGKIIGNYLVLLVPFIISIIISLMVLNISGSVDIYSRGILAPFLVILIATLLFILVMFNLGILASTLTHRSITSIVTLLFIWTIFVLTLPKISTMIAEIIYPVKSQQVLDLEKMLVRQDLEKELDHKKRALFDEVETQLGMQDIGASVGTGSPEEKAVHTKFDELKKPMENEYNQRIDNEVNKLQQEYVNRRNVQQLIGMNLSRISPASSYNYLISEISSTGVLEMNNVLKHAQRFQDEVKENIYDKFIIKSYGGLNGGTATMIDWAKGFNPHKAQVPNLAYHQTDLGDAMRAEWVDILLLFLFNIIFFSAGVVIFNRYDVR
ncbi:MAG: ABC transporter permease [Bacteroidota bacterium]